jgi:hypothetical protein
LEEGLLVARTEIARLIHAPVEEVVVLENVTAAASMIALDVMWAFAEGRFNQGDSILMLNCAYGAVKKAFKVCSMHAPNPSSSSWLASHLHSQNPQGVPSPLTTMVRSFGKLPAFLYGQKF